MGRLGVARPVMMGKFFTYWLFFNIEGSLPHLSLQPPPPLIVRNFPSSALFNYSSSRENKKNHKDISSVSSFFFQGCHFSNLFSFLRFEGLVNRNVKLVICAFIIFRFLPLSNINLMFKRSDSLNKNYLHP